SDGPSWGIPLMNASEFPEMDPYEEYHTPSDDDIQVKDDDENPEEDLEEDPSEEHEPEDDDEDPEKDPNKEHEPEDEDTKEPSKGSDETEPLEEDKIAIMPPPPKHHGARISVRPQTPMAGQGLIRSPGHDTQTIARATDRAEDVGYVRALQASERRMMTSNEEVNLRASYQTQLEKIESLFHISGCAIDNQLKFATCTLLGAALTWWNGCVRTLGHDAAYAMTWRTLKKNLMDKYCLKGEIKKPEIELWNLRVKGNDVIAYTQRFQELALMCTKFLADETKKVDKYISGLPDNIHENVVSARPKTLDETIELANDMMDQKLRT
nr:reverse transcriptase domain-containing protein [Tanacetum cinerariifolium]